MRIDKRAGQPGLTKQIPLCPDLRAHQLPGPSRQPDGPTCPPVRTVPRPRRAGDGLRIVQVEMPTHLEAWVLLRPTDCVSRPRLAGHQTGSVQHAVEMSLDDGLVHLRVHPEIIGNEKHFSVAHSWRRFCPNGLGGAIADHGFILFQVCGSLFLRITSQRTGSAAVGLC